MMSKRQPNFSLEEVEMLVNAVDKHSKVLFAKFSGIVSVASKERAWQTIATERGIGGVCR